MPFYLVTRRAQFHNEQKFVVEAPNEENAGYIESIDVDAYKMISSESSNWSGWNTEDEDKEEITEKEAQKLFKQPTAHPHGEDSNRAVQTCISDLNVLFEEKRSKASAAVLETIEEMIKVLKKRLPYPTAGAPIEGWPMRDEPDYCIKHRSKD